MSGDWIKMRTNLWDDPRVSGLCDATGAKEATVVGALYWLWSAADAHSEDGHMQGLTLATIDRKTALKGFGAALLVIDWISESEGGIDIARFDEHNGASAKKRAQTARRVAKNKSGNAELTLEALANEEECVSDALPREEKRREEKRREEKIETSAEPKEDHGGKPFSSTASTNGLAKYPPGFEDFYAQFPKKVGKDAAARAYGRRKFSGEDRERLVEAIARQREWPTWKKNGGEFIPHPATWLNEGRWDDEAPRHSTNRADQLMADNDAAVAAFIARQEET